MQMHRNQDKEQDFLNKMNKHAGILGRVCNSYFTDPRERQDAAQEILYQLWKSFDSFQGTAKFSTWMYKVALNTAMLHLRNKRQAVSLSGITDTMPEWASADDDNASEENMQLLYAAINSLPDVDKAIVLLYLDEYSYDEIAAVTGMSKSNVSVRLVRIRKKLEEKIKNHHL